MTAAYYLEGKSITGRGWIEDNILYLAKKYGIELDMEEMTEDEIYTQSTYKAYADAAALIIDTEFSSYTKFNKEFKKDVKSISKEAENLLLNYPWHGNARELRNVVERICILESTDIIYPEHLPSEIIEHLDEVSEKNASIDLPSEGLSLKNVEKDLSDEIAKRIKEGKPIYLHEFLYPLMQGYDSVAMDVDVEIGGTDQTFNMLAGRALQRKINNKEKFVITTTLLENPVNGKKLMNKSEGSFIALNDSPEDMFGKIMSLPDEAINKMFTDLTLVSIEEIEEIMETNTNPRDAKLILAEKIVEIYHGEKKAKEARENFIKTFSKKGTPKNVPEVKAGENILETFASAGTGSNTEIRRLVSQGAITNLDTGETISDPNQTPTLGTYRIGKHRFLKIIK